MNTGLLRLRYNYFWLELKWLYHCTNEHIFKHLCPMYENMKHTYTYASGYP